MVVAQDSSSWLCATSHDTGCLTFDKERVGKGSVASGCGLGPVGLPPRPLSRSATPAHDTPTPHCCGMAHRCGHTPRNGRVGMPPNGGVC